MMKRGVLYVVYGNSVEAMLARSIASVKTWHSDWNIHVARVDGSSHLEKTRMFELSPFEETLFLDVDTVVLGKLDFGFTQSARFGLACCIAPCPWARRYRGIQGDIVEYNTGVLFFNRSAAGLFTTWKSLSPQVDSSLRKRGRRGNFDQASFAKAVADTNTNPFVLPLNWNFRPHSCLSFFGPVKIWHDHADPPAALRAICAEQSKGGAEIKYHRRGAWV